MKFYLAGPIGDVRNYSYTVWRLQVEKHLAALGHTSINPVSENTAQLKDKLENYRELKLFDDVREEMQSILLHDELEVIRADAVLARSLFWVDRGGENQQCFKSSWMELT